MFRRMEIYPELMDGTSHYALRMHPPKNYYSKLLFLKYIVRAIRTIFTLDKSCFTCRWVGTKC